MSEVTASPQEHTPSADGRGSRRRLLGATALMASGTAISRVLGLVRAVMIAFILGNATLRANVLNLALTVPSSLYLLLAGGTLNNVLVPQIIRAVKQDSDGGKAFVDRIMTGFVIVLGALTVVFTVGAPLVMSIYTKDVWRAPEMAEQWRSLLLMSYLTMPQVFFYGVFFLIGQVLNAREKYGPMMWAPILNNVVAIATLGVYLAVWGTQTSKGMAFSDQQVWMLGIGSSLGIVAQTLILIPYLRMAGFSYRPRFDLKGTGLGQTFHVAKWMVGYVALTSLAQVVVTNLASGGLPTADGLGGGVNAYGNAYLIWVLPHSLITVSLATAMLPSASSAAQEGRLEQVAAETVRAIRLALTFLLPASVAFIALADPIARVPYGNGVGAGDYHLVSWALMAFGVGLVPFTIQYLYLRAFYALDNTKTPFLLQIWVSGANVVLAIAFVTPWDDPATVAARLALAYSASYLIGVFLTHQALRRRLPELDGLAVLRHLGRLSVPTIAAVALAWVVTWLFAGNASALLRLAGFALAAAAAVLVFFFVAKRMGVPEAASLLDVLRRRKTDDGDADAVEAIVDESETIVTGDPSGDTPNLDPDGTGVFVPVSEPLDYPAPDSAAVAGLVLADRYELAEQLAINDGIQTWRAHDPVLGRPVLVHLLANNDTRTPRILTAARAAAVATDSRFLRVLDVVEAAGGVNAYLVYEYEAGQSLEKLLREGPLTSVETAWVVREVSEALVAVHAQGHFHQHLNPATVLITANGNVKILGFETDAAMHSDGTPASVSTAMDVQALGDLLYACLVAHWPRGERFGLPAAPVEHGRAVAPSRVRGGVAPALDLVIDRIRSGNPRGHASRLFTAAAVAAELSSILGPADASSGLRTRLGAAGQSEIATLQSPPIPTPATSHTFVTSRVSADEAPDAAVEETEQPFVDSALAHSDSFTPIPPPGPSPHGPRNIPLLLLSSALVIAVGLVAAAIITVQATQAAVSPLVAVAEVDDFDPKGDGGSGGENSAGAVLAADGSLATIWTTDTYRSAKFKAKPGVGLMVDLGTVHSVKTVTVHLTGQGSDLDVRVPKNPSSSGSTKTVADWRVVNSVTNAGDVATFSMGNENTRYLLVYFTGLPPIGNGKYQGGIAEIEVMGS
jgi:murein biosynthesis integral membrane protein MurJ